MNYDLKIIKKKYGEKFSQLCRELFPTLLEEKGLLSKLLLDNFNESHYLYQDIIDNELEDDFKNYIYSLVEKERNKDLIITKTPSELMDEAGYILYECKTEEDIQQFKKYYAPNEKICTFKGDRLDKCYVYFAVKKNVDEINRNDFKNPNREDEYGTSVISIQFTKNDSHTLSIKNRYNHKVNNPDATFSNNLDNIIPGLTESFAKYYGMVQKSPNVNFNIPKYIRASDGKFYKYNYGIDNICFCPNNIIIDNFEVIKYDKSRYLIIEYFILDLVNKKLELYDNRISDCFVDCIKNINKIDVKNVSNGKKIDIIYEDNNKMEITIDVFGRITKLKCEQLRVLSNSFLLNNKVLNELDLPNLESIGFNFLFNNKALRELNLPSLKYVDDNFLYSNKKLINLYLPNLEEIGRSFLFNNDALRELNLPSLKCVDKNFLYFNEKLMKLELPNLEEIGDEFLWHNIEITSLSFPKVKSIGDYFLSCNTSLMELYVPKLESIQLYFMSRNKVLTLVAPNLKRVDDYFLLKHPARYFLLKQINDENTFVERMAMKLKKVKLRTDIKGRKIW